MSLSEQEWHDLLDPEMYVDLTRLRDSSRRGIVPRMRNETWRYLTHVAHPDKSDEMTRQSQLAEEYRAIHKQNSDVSRAFRAFLLTQDAMRPKSDIDSFSVLQKRLARSKLHEGDLSRAMSPKHTVAEVSVTDYLSQLAADQTAGAGAASSARDDFLAAWSSKAVTASLERILSAFSNAHPYVDFDISNMYLATILVLVFESESDAYFAFVTVLKWYAGAFMDYAELPHRVAKFMMLLRCTQPRLYEWLLEEEVEENTWALSWMKYFLHPHLPIACSLRLCDSYFSCATDTEREELHMCVCLALLQTTHETMREFDYSEIHLFLHELPYFDMDKLLERAYNTREYIRSKNLL